MTRDLDQMICPKCGEIAVAEFVDIGVGMQQCSPFVCQTCGWVQEQPEFKDPENET